MNFKFPTSHMKNITFNTKSKTDSLHLKVKSDNSL